MALKKNRTRTGKLPSGADYRVTQTAAGKAKTVRASAHKESASGTARTVVRTSSTKSGGATPKAKRTEVVGKSGKTPSGNKYTSEVYRYKDSGHGAQDTHVAKKSGGRTKHYNKFTNVPVATGRKG